MTPADQPPMYWDELVRAARARIGARYAGHIDASSIVQDVYLELCQRGAAPDLPELRTRVRHKIIDAVRRLGTAKRGGGPPQRLEQDDSQGLRAPGPSPSQVAVRQEVRELLETTSALDEDESHVLRARYLEGLTYREIATNLGVSLGSIAKILSSGLRKLRVRLRKEP